MGSPSMSLGYNSRELHNVFVYGSLMAEEVVGVILKRVPQSSPATLNGFHRFSIKGRVYPAILPMENKKITGKVLSGITSPELDLLDAFEDIEYERRTVEVSLMDGYEKLQAFAYVWADCKDPNLYGEWNFEEWRRVHMNNFVEMTKGFMEEQELPESKPRVATYESFYQQQ
ncbi:AIG2-like protein D [Diospyros lotus]|uniref:AIG2-like protein D n=1 Tax=Diospyros lotus TaxID=55363 RepID=UPI002250578B|nr:AIG2-like protein D [Diospyros lotus]